MKPDLLKTINPVEGAATTATGERYGRNNSRHHQASRGGQSFAQALDVARQREQSASQRNISNNDERPADKPAVAKHDDSTRVNKDGSQAKSANKQTDAQEETFSDMPDASEGSQAASRPQTSQADESAFHDNPMDANSALLGKEPTPTQAATAATQETADFAKQLAESVEGTSSAELHNPEGTSTGQANQPAQAVSLGQAGDKTQTADKAAHGSPTTNIAAVAGEGEPLVDPDITAITNERTTGDKLSNETTSRAAGEGAKPATAELGANQQVRTDHSLFNNQRVTEPQGTETSPRSAAPTPAQAQENIKSFVNVVAPLRHRGDGDYSVTLKLHPAHLGSVEIVVTLSGGQVSMSMNTDNAGARDMLRQQMDDLRQSLEDAGLSTGSLDVSQENSFRQHLDGDESASATNRLDSNEPEIEDQQPAQHVAISVPAEHAAPGELDIRL